MIYNNPSADFGVCVQCMFTLTHLIADKHYPTLLKANKPFVSFHQYAPHYVSNVHGKFQSCAVGVQAATMISNKPKADLGVCVQCMFKHTH